MMVRGQIRIGVMATLAGPFRAMGEDGIRGAELAFNEAGGKLAGQRLYLFQESTNAIPDSAVQAADALLTRDEVDFIIGPLSGNEGIAIRDYAKRHPERAFINGTAGAQEITLRNPAPNFFSFSSNGVQGVAGLGTFAYEAEGYRRVVTLAEAYSYPFAQVGGFMLEFCRAGGKVVDKFWVALGTTDFRPIIAALPTDIDAIFVALGGTDAVNFLRQYDEVGRHVPLIAGIATLDNNVLGGGGALTEKLIGMVSAGPTADDNPNPAWQAFVAAYHRKFPHGLHAPSLVAYSYYVNMKAALLALEKVDGNLSDGQADFMEALQTLDFHAPCGRVHLDHNRNAVANNFIRRVDQDKDGSLYHHLVKVIPEVGQTLGIPEDQYLSLKAFDKDNPSCP